LQRLKSDKAIEKLFANGKSVFIHPIKLVYLQPAHLGELSPVISVGVSVSKRNFKRAIDRNRIKRLLRESIRLQEDNVPVAHLDMMAIYIAKELPDFETIDRTIKRLFKKIKNF
jgi:ribonuclease P protein component